MKRRSSNRTGVHPSIEGLECRCLLTRPAISVPELAAAAPAVHAQNAAVQHAHAESVMLRELRLQTAARLREQAHDAAVLARISAAAKRAASLEEHRLALELVHGKGKGKSAAPTTTASTPTTVATVTTPTAGTTAAPVTTATTPETTAPTTTTTETTTRTPGPVVTTTAPGPSSPTPTTTPIQSPTTAAATPSLLGLVDDSLLVTSLYDSPQHIMTGIYPDGAVGGNEAYIQGTTSVFYVELQRYGAEYLQAAAITGNQALMAQGWQIVNLAFDRMLGPDGTFSLSGDNWHSTALFIEDVARAMLVLKETNTIGAYGADVTRAIQVCHTCAEWMMGPMKLIGDERDLPYTHRRFMVSALLLEVGQLTGDATLTADATAYAQSGLALQFTSAAEPPYSIVSSDTGKTISINRDGVFPEKYQPGVNSGWDASYQNVSLKYASITMELLPAGALRNQLLAAITRGVDFEMRLGLTSGLLETNGSTRIDTGEVSRSGLPKTVNYTDAVWGLSYAAAATGNTQFQTFANKMAAAVPWVNPTS